jgi:CRP-like cAMP-binding protein
MDHFEALKKFPLLKDITDDELKELIKLLTENKFAKGDKIITEGDEGNVMYVLIAGSVDIIKTTIYGEKFVCATLNENMHPVFGEMALLDNDKRSATVMAKTECVTLSIDTKSFNEYIDKYPRAGIVLLKLMNLNLIRNIRVENENLKLVYQALIEEIESN